MHFTVPPAAGSIRIKSSVPAPVVINFQGHNLSALAIQHLRADTGEPGVMRLVHLPAGDYGFFARGSRWVNVRLDRGEQSVELAPFTPPSRRPPK
jgi:hypothetical protein